LKNAKKIFGKSKAKELAIKCYSDSELMVRQLNHQYKLKEERIQKYFIDIWNLTLDFREVRFFHIPREENKQADKLANRAMDRGE
jgi:ribonuclease HI